MIDTFEHIDPITGEKKELYSYLAEDKRRDRDLNKYFFSRRQINSFELDDKLRRFERWGVQVPTLNFSKIMPLYSETTEDDVEIYQPGSIRVPAGCVIDHHGNVVNLRALEEEMLITISRKPTTEQLRSK